MASKRGSDQSSWWRLRYRSSSWSLATHSTRSAARNGSRSSSSSSSLQEVSTWAVSRSEEHTSELQSRGHLVCRLLLEKKKTTNNETFVTKCNGTTTDAHNQNNEPTNSSS